VFLNDAGFIAPSSHVRAEISRKCREDRSLRRSHSKVALDVRYRPAVATPQWRARGASQARRTNGRSGNKGGLPPCSRTGGHRPGRTAGSLVDQQNDNPTPDPMDTCALGADSTNSPTAQIASQPSCAANTPAGSLRPIRLISVALRHWPEVAPRPPAMPGRVSYLPASVAILRCSAARAL
jgi:hypothetical protein